jgi:uncharacterized protein with NAD-binding domain and iron-sulfur cluster
MKVVIIGAGVAGLAAAVALARDGADVTLLERRAYVGGRAYSYPHPALAETIDSQHVILGCCTNFIDLITQSGAADTIRWYDELTFLEPPVHPAPSSRHSGPEGNEGEEPLYLKMSAAPQTPVPIRTRLYPTHLPAPFHQSLAFLRAPMLTLRDKAGIAAGLAHFLRGCPATDEESFASWLQRTHQTGRSIRHFWEPVIVAALNDSFANCSTKYAGKVFHESFLRSPEAGRLGIPTTPLSDFFAPVAAHARTLGVDLRLNSSVTALTPLPGNRWRITSAPGEIDADAIILATNLRQTQHLLEPLSAKTSTDVHTSSLPWSSSGALPAGRISSGLQPAERLPSGERALAPGLASDEPPRASTSSHPAALAPAFASDLLPPDHASRYPEASASGLSPTPEDERAIAPGLCTSIAFDQFTTAPITTIHLWYDREITAPDHAVLLDTRIQWLFHKSRIRRWEPARGSYLELVISASFPELALSREKILASALAELELFFPQVREATLLKSAVLKEARATFSVTPSLDAHRPPQTTAYPNLFVAGDWTATNWPSTMEGAIRSGRLAAGTLTGRPTRFLSPELPATGLMRFLSRKL